MTTPTPPDMPELKRYKTAREILKDVVGLSWDNETATITMTPDSFVRCIDRASRPTPPADATAGNPVPRFSEWSQPDTGTGGAAIEHLKTALYLIGNRSAWQFDDPIEFHVKMAIEILSAQSPAPVTDAQREDRQMVDELIEYFEHRPQLPRLNGSPFQRVMFDLGAIPENGVKAIIKCLRAALSAPVAQVDVQVEPLVKRILKEPGVKRTSYATILSAIRFVTRHYHLTPKTQEAEG